MFYLSPSISAFLFSFSNSFRPGSTRNFRSGSTLVNVLVILEFSYWCSNRFRPGFLYSFHPGSRLVFVRVPYLFYTSSCP